MKRKFSDYQCSPSIKHSTRSKKPCLVRPYQNNDDKKGYISASSVINWFSGDCLLDWLKIRKEILPSDSKYTEENYLCEQGNKFEKAVVDYISKNITPVFKVGDSDKWSSSLVKKTISFMQEGVPIIYSAAVRNKNLKLFGTSDLLVRNDYISKLFSKIDILEDEHPNTLFNHPYYYVIVDIKWCTLRLASNGQEVLNSDRFPGYKGQLNIYNRCLAEMQGYKPLRTYLLGRKYNYTSKGKNIVNKSPFEKPGIVYTNDISFNLQVDQAISWLRDLQKYGSIMTVNPPSRIELYPNLGSKYYYAKKRELAEQIGDLSLLYNVKKSTKVLAFNQGIYNIYDVRLNGKTFNFKGRDEKIIDNILKINRGTDIFLPTKFTNNLMNWKEKDNEVYVDFEKFTDIIDDFKDISNHYSFDYIYLIGIWYKNESGIWQYEKFLAEYPNRENELNIINQFLDWIEEKGNPKIWYYFAEEKFWNIVKKRYNIQDNLRWCDLRKILIEEPFVIKGCYDYKLKSILEAMKKQGLINLKNESNCKDGFVAMLEAWKYYQGKTDQKEMDEIIKYNKFDVRGMYEIMTFIRDL
jgi:hypothetical protein